MPIAFGGQKYYAVINEAPYAAAGECKPLIRVYVNLKEIMPR